MDAASTDGSVDVIKEYAKTSPHPVIWSSEKDKGIYDGMNRGICKATIDFQMEVEGQRKPALKGEATFLYYFK